MSTPAAWDRRDGESARAYAAFCAYRDLGPTRSLDKAHRADASLPQDSPKTAPRHWTDWSSAYDWPARAEAYDAHRELQARRRREAEHDEKLRAHIEQQERLATATIEASARALQLATARLRKINPEDLKPSDIPAYLRAAAAVAEAATNARAQAIGVTDLLHLLQDNGDGNG